MTGTPGAPLGWTNVNSPMSDWMRDLAPAGSIWSAGNPEHQGQQATFNPATGATGYVNTAGGTQIGGVNPYGHGAVSWVDPTTGLRAIDPSMIKSLMGQFGLSGSGSGGGYQSFTPSEYTPAEINTPAAYGGFDYDTIGSGIDPGAVIAAQEYKLQEAMEGDMARAGGRLGQSGMAMSTPYANSLGESARKASQDRNALTMQYQYDAAQQQAARDLAQQLQAAQQDFGAWQQGGNWDMQSQMFGAQNAFDAWLAENTFGMQNNQGQNAWNANNQDFQQQLLASILGGLF